MENWKKLLLKEILRRAEQIAGAYEVLKDAKLADEMDDGFTELSGLLEDVRDVLYEHPKFVTVMVKYMLSEDDEFYIEDRNVRKKVVEMENTKMRMKSMIDELIEMEKQRPVLRRTQRRFGSTKKQLMKYMIRFMLALRDLVAIIKKNSGEKKL